MEAYKALLISVSFALVLYQNMMNDSEFVGTSIKIKSLSTKLA